MDRRSRLEVAYSSLVSAGFSTGFSYALVARNPVDRTAQLASALQGCELDNSTGFSYALVARNPVDRPAQLASALQGCELHDVLQVSVKDLASLTSQPAPTTPGISGQ